MSAVTARAGRLAVAGVLALALAGCTLSAAEEEPSGAASEPGPGGAVTASASPEAAPSPEPSGPSAAELSEQLLAAAGRPQALASGAGEVENGSPTQVDVLEVRAVEGGTFVRLTFATTDGSTFNMGPTTFAGDRFGTQNFLRDLYLDDAAGGTRYLPLQFEDYRDACVCPYKPFEVGPEPQEAHALFPAVPEGTEVSLSLPRSDIVVEGLTVAGG